MRVVVYPHDLIVGGSQLNAIDIAATLHARGHETVLFGQPGPLAAHAEKLGLEVVEAPEPRRRPSPSVVRALGALVDARGIGKCVGAQVGHFKQFHAAFYQARAERGGKH